MHEADVVPALRELGFSEPDAQTLADHFTDAERRGKHGHGFSRVEWLATRPFELDPAARPSRVLREPGYERWEGNGALGWRLLVASLVAEPGDGAVLLVARREADPLPALRARAAGVRLPGQG